MKFITINLVLGFALQCWAWAPENVDLYKEDTAYDSSEEFPEELESAKEPSEDFLFEAGYGAVRSTNCSVMQGVASWYGPGFDGNRTANGERFDQEEFTAAHRHLKFDSIVRVTYRGRSVDVRINDRGPFVKGRVIDLSKAAAQEIGLIAAGHGRVTLELVSCGAPLKLPQTTAV